MTEPESHALRDLLTNVSASNAAADRAFDQHTIARKHWLKMLDKRNAAQQDAIKALRAAGGIALIDDYLYRLEGTRIVCQRVAHRDSVANTPLQLTGG